MKSFITILSILSFLIGCASVKKNERFYQTNFCKKLNGTMEYRLKDNTRIDCITNELAIEVDWARKWAEAVGQSLYYAEMTDKQASIALIVTSKDQRFIKRANKLAKKFNIKIFIIEKQ